MEERLKAESDQDVGGELPALIDRLHETYARIRQIVSEEADAVVHAATGATYPLPRARAELREVARARRLLAAERAAILDGLPARIALIDETGRIVMVNEAWRRFGRENGAGPERGWVGEDYLADSDAVSGAAIGIRGVLSARMPRFTLEYLAREPDKERWFRMDVTRLGNGAVGGAVVMHVDVTDRVQAQIRAETLSTRLGDILESTNDAVLTLDRRLRFTYLNSRAERLLERPAHELIGKRVAVELADLTAETFAEISVWFARAVAPPPSQAAASLDFTTYSVRLARWFEVNAKSNADGVSVFFRDVTQQRDRDEHLRLLETAVARQNDTLMITDAPIDAPDGPRVVYVNDAFTRMTGYAREEALGSTPRILQGPATQRDRLDLIREALTAQRPIRVELINRTRAGQDFWVEIDIAPILDPSGNLTHFVAVERDITDRKATEEELRLGEERLRRSEKFELIGQLTGGIAHDFNNILTIILSNAEMMSEQLGDRKPLRLLAEMTATAAERGAELTHQLLAFARRQALEPKPVDVGRLIAKMDSLIRRTIREDIDIEVTQGAGLWMTELDPTQLESAMINLAVNASQAMPEGGRLTIDTANTILDGAYAAAHVEVEPGEYVTVSVSDTGTGMLQSVAEKAFEPFFTTKGVGKGTGLGLSMVYGFAKQSNGHATINSNFGFGTTVKLYFPRLQYPVESEIISPDTDKIIGGNEHILVVEDDDTVRKTLCTHLLSLGYRISEAASGTAALEVFKHMVDIDLVFTDMVMPGEMNGRKLAEAVQTLRPRVKVLFTSGYTDNDVSHDGRSTAGVHLLSKPYRRQVMAAKVRSVLDSVDGPTGG